MSDLKDTLHLDDHALWALIGVCVALIFTLQAVQAAVEGAWPHERRPAKVSPQARSSAPLWGAAAIALLIGGILLILNLAMMVWKDLERTDGQVVGSILLSICWVIFVFASFDDLKLRNYLTSVGVVAPLALLIILIVADVMLLVAFLDIHPTLKEVEDEVPLVITWLL